jgi:hypothetical protein
MYTPHYAKRVYLQENEYVIYCIVCNLILNPKIAYEKNLKACRNPGQTQGKGK